MATRRTPRAPRGPVKQRLKVESHLLMTVDPGWDNLGVAIFWHGKLRMCDALYARWGHDLYQMRKMGDVAAQWFRDNRPGRCSTRDATLAIERMRGRPENKDNLAITDKLIDLGVISGVILGQGAADHLIHVEPAHWTQMRPKPVNHERIKKRLDAEETAVLDSALKRCDNAEHIDILDAVGIGLHLLHRL